MPVLLTSPADTLAHIFDIGKRYKNKLHFTEQATECLQDILDIVGFELFVHFCHHVSDSFKYTRILNKRYIIGYHASATYTVTFEEVNEFFRHYDDKQPDELKMDTILHRMK